MSEPNDSVRIVVATVTDVTPEPRRVVVKMAEVPPAEPRRVIVRYADDPARAKEGAMPKRNCVALDLSDEEAEALAVVCKRFDREDAERFGNRFDGGKENEAILCGVDILRQALARAGFDPR